MNWRLRNTHCRWWAMIQILQPLILWQLSSAQYRKTRKRLVNCCKASNHLFFYLFTKVISLRWSLIDMILNNPLRVQNDKGGNKALTQKFIFVIFRKKHQKLWSSTLEIKRIKLTWLILSRFGPLFSSTVWKTTKSFTWLIVMERLIN